MASQLSSDEWEQWWQEAGRSELQQLLFWQWDPIGVNDHFPLTSDEYDEYSDPIGSLLQQGADVETVATYLDGIEEGAMELGCGNRHDEQLRNVARTILDWRHNSIFHWQMENGQRG